MPNSRIISMLSGTALLLTVASCGGADTPETKTAKPAEAHKETTSTSNTASPSETIDAVLVGAHRSDEEKARDAFRHPKETLMFFDITPDQKVAELFPGRGWYTKVIAPYMTSGSGQYIAVNFNPGDNERRQAGLQAFKDSFADKEVYGEVAIGLIGGDAVMAEPGTLDTVLTFRNVHNWMAGGVSEDFFAQFYASLKPGGVLGVVEHRGDENVEQDPTARSGYVNESTVIAMAEAAGFELEARSDINANPNDTRDHPFGVWTLPPVKRSSATRGETDPDFDRAKYDAIGESDRMTLKFRKPHTAEGGLLE